MSTDVCYYFRTYPEPPQNIGADVGRCVITWTYLPRPHMLPPPPCARPGSRLRWYDSGGRESLIYARLPPCARPGPRPRWHENNDIGTDIGRCAYTTTWTSQP